VVVPRGPKNPGFDGAHYGPARGSGRLCGLCGGHGRQHGRAHGALTVRGVRTRRKDARRWAVPCDAAASQGPDASVERSGGLKPCPLPGSRRACGKA
jgi:hypothetical protein